MAANGLSRRLGASHSAIALAALAGALHPLPASAQQPATIHIEAETLDRALIDLARQTGVEIVSTEPGLRRIRTPAIDGRLSMRQALERLLAGSGYRAERSGKSFRIVLAPRARQAGREAPPAAMPQRDIIITASKQRIDRQRYPGTFNAIDFAGSKLSASTPHGSDMLGDTLPIVEQTALGPGRNKSFVRGIADSSFAGATQSTVSVYFGESQLVYSGADPDLKLVDVTRVEVLEGPQGTLYGAGAIGGIVRIIPNPVALDATKASVGAGVSATLGGAPGADGQAMVNLPIITDRLGVRLVGYGMRDGGYIDDRLRGLNNVNTTDTLGARAEMKAASDNGWTIGAGALWQRIDTADLGYAQRGLASLTRGSRVAQPFGSTLVQGHATVTHDWNSGLQLVVAAGITSLRAAERFDVSPPVGPTALYINHIDSQLITLETRLAHTGPHGSWVFGLALLRNADAQDRAVGAADMPTEIVGVTNIARSASAFGEVTLPLSPRLSATLGVRGTFGRNEATPSVRQRGSPYFAGQQTLRADPTVALTYRIDPGFTLYARGQTGYRTGGLAVARGIGRTAEFQPDSIAMGEVGFRLRRGERHPIEVSGAVAYARWDNIQADLFSRRGQPYTTTLGNARILSVEGHVRWQPLPGLYGDAALLFTDNSVDGPIASTSTQANRRLAQVPAIAANGAAGYRWSVGNGDTLSIDTTARYVGRALLGTGDFLDIAHPPYVVFGAQMQWTHGRTTLTLAGDNLLNSHVNRFSLGNPLQIAARDQITPLRPLTVRLGASMDF